jgi:hypothetical protein
MKITEVIKMYGISLVTYREAKDMCRYIVIDGATANIEDDVYGVLINNKFMPVIMEGMCEYLRAGEID